MAEFVTREASVVYIGTYRLDRYKSTLELYLISELAVYFVVPFKLFDNMNEVRLRKVYEICHVSGFSTIRDGFVAKELNLIEEVPVKQGS